ncbi:hypothetical protein X777_06828 [Ooceraea biroi]|uniref:Uncharacterized protein n=1 Tax=Ooceraea biroi TaxID=2015173 RepID=A0A026WDH6_OOCBI|nr:hypothetical protein X777_06828 [Ooceraea biroi]
MGMKNQVAPSSPESDTPGSWAQVELRNWLEARLDVLGIRNPSTHSRLVLDFLCFPFSVLYNNTSEEAFGVPGSSGGDGSLRLRQQDKVQHDSEQRQILVDNLMNLCDQIYPVNMLADELCSRLNEIREAQILQELEELNRLIDYELQCLSTSFTDDSEDNLAAFTPEDEANWSPLATSTPEATDNLFQKETETFFINPPAIDEVDLSAENGITNDQGNGGTELVDAIRMCCDPAHVYSTVNPADMISRELDVDLDDYQDLINKIFNDEVEEIWYDPLLANDQVPHICTSPEALEVQWPAGTFLERLTMKVTVPWLHIVHDKNGAIYQTTIVPVPVNQINMQRQDSCQNAEINFMLLGQPTNAAGHNIWSHAAAENDNSWPEYFKDSELSANVPAIPQGSDRIPPPPDCQAEDREVLYAFLEGNSEPEDLLTSSRTHFRPIREDGEWADGTTFPIDNSVERITYRRSESGRLYLPGSETPYREYRDNIERQSESFVIRFRVRQNDVATQADLVRKPAAGSSIADCIDTEEDSESDSVSEVDPTVHSDTDTDSDTESDEESDRNPNRGANGDSAADLENNADHEPDPEPNPGFDAAADSGANSLRRRKRRDPKDSYSTMAQFGTTTKSISSSFCLANPYVRRELTYVSTPDTLDVDHSLHDESADVKTRRRRSKGEYERVGDFDVEFPPLRGLSPVTAERLKTVVPVHYTGERKLSILNSGRRNKIIPINI